MRTITLDWMLITHLMGIRLHRNGMMTMTGFPEILKGKAMIVITIRLQFIRLWMTNDCLASFFLSYT